MVESVTLNPNGSFKVDFYSTFFVSRPTFDLTIYLMILVGENFNLHGYESIGVGYNHHEEV